MCTRISRPMNKENAASGVVTLSGTAGQIFERKDEMDTAIIVEIDSTMHVNQDTEDTSFVRSSSDEKLQPRPSFPIHVLSGAARQLVEEGERTNEVSSVSWL